MNAVVKIVLIIATCALAASCENGAGARGVPGDVRQFLGERAVGILQQVQRVELYRVRRPMPGATSKPAPGTNPSSRPLGGLQILATAPEQDAAFGRNVAALFLSSDAYRFGVAKGCIFQPDTLVRVHGPGGSVEFTLCFSCSEFEVATFDVDGKPVQANGNREDFDGVADRLKALIDSGFQPRVAAPRTAPN